MISIIHVGRISADDSPAQGWLVNADAELVALEDYKVTPATPLVSFWCADTHCYVFDSAEQAKSRLLAAGYEQ